MKAIQCQRLTVSVSLPSGSDKNEGRRSSRVGMGLLGATCTLRDTPIWGEGGGDGLTTSHL